ncbi:MAG: GIY-YIG nuclease family protein [Bacteroidetes bacterium]|nr:GIY-YIG nuclease family protein [Bacteroidota bacterium]
MYYTYVLFSLKDSHLYTGYTSDIQKRLSEHNEGLVASTKHRRPFVLVYHEVCLNQKDALRREKYLKSGNGKIYIGNRLKHYFSNMNSKIQRGT